VFYVKYIIAKAAADSGQEIRCETLGKRDAIDPTAAQINAKRRFHDAVSHAGPRLADILWRVVCAGEGMRDAETALGRPARAGKLVLTFALDRGANYYRIR
jgi:hypothetical protein